MTEFEVHPKKYFEQIEVFGSMEKRSWIHGPKSPKRFFLNESKCPGRNPIDRIDGVVGEEGIKMFDGLVWQSGMKMGIFQMKLKSGLKQEGKILNLEQILILFVIVEDLEVKMMM